MLLHSTFIGWCNILCVALNRIFYKVCFVSDTLLCFLYNFVTFYVILILIFTYVCLLLPVPETSSNSTSYHFLEDISSEINA